MERFRVMRLSDLAEEFLKSAYEDLVVSNDALASRWRQSTFNSYGSDIEALMLELIVNWTPQAWVLNNGAWNIIRLPDRDASLYQEAVELAERANIVDPDDLGKLNTLGIAYYRNGEFQKCIETLSKSSELRRKLGVSYEADLPSNAIFRAMAHAKLMEGEKAQTLMEAVRGRVGYLDFDAEDERFLAEAEQVTAH